MDFSNKATRVTVIAGIGLFALALVLAAAILSNTNFYIKNLGTSLVQDGKLINTISVTGDGKVYAKPDMAEITISVSELANTSGEALNNANEKINQVNQILQAKGVASEDIKTSQLSIYPEYDYSRNGESILKGQRATVSLSVKIKGLDEKATKATQIIDEVSKVSNIQLGSISFDIEDKTKLFTQARELAFQKAKQKATELSGFAGVKMLTPVSITDSTVDVVQPPVLRNVAEAAPAADSSKGSTSISTGQLEVSINLSVVWGIE